MLAHTVGAAVSIFAHILQSIGMCMSEDAANGNDTNDKPTEHRAAEYNSLISDHSRNHWSAREIANHSGQPPNNDNLIDTRRSILTPDSAALTDSMRYRQAVRDYSNLATNPPAPTRIYGSIRSAGNRFIKNLRHPLIDTLALSLCLNRNFAV